MVFCSLCEQSEPNFALQFIHSSVCPWSYRKKPNPYAQALVSKLRGVGDSFKNEGQWEGLVVHAEEREVSLWSGLKGGHQESLDPAPGQLLQGKWLSCGVERLETMVLG